MTGYTAHEALSKASRALELHEKGISTSVIAQRLGVHSGSIRDMIKLAKQRREAAKEQAQ